MVNDFFIDNLHVPIGSTLITNGFKLHIRGDLKIGGIIHNNGAGSAGGGTYGTFTGKRTLGTGKSGPTEFDIGGKHYSEGVTSEYVTSEYPRYNGGSTITVTFPYVGRDKGITGYISPGGGVEDVKMNVRNTKLSDRYPGNPDNLFLDLNTISDVSDSVGKQFQGGSSGALGRGIVKSAFSDRENSAYGGGGGGVISIIARTITLENKSKTPMISAKGYIGEGYSGDTFQGPINSDGGGGGGGLIVILTTTSIDTLSCDVFDVSGGSYLGSPFGYKQGYGMGQNGAVFIRQIV